LLNKDNLRLLAARIQSSENGINGVEKVISGNRWQPCFLAVMCPAFQQISYVAQTRRATPVNGGIDLG